MIDVLIGPVITIGCLGILALLLSNLKAIARPPRRPESTDLPSITVCIPARDEQDTIKRCLAAVLEQDVPVLEILVLDDRSQDSTAEIVRSFADPRISLIAGDDLPAGWTGKNWACHQLARRARGELLCFLDADTVLEPSAVSGAAGVLVEHDAGLVTMLLAAENHTVGEAVLLPMVNHFLLALFPAALMHHHPHPMIALAMGPFILVSRDAYDAAGGHAASPDHIVDDVRLCRAIKGAGWPVRLVNGTDVARTRWYSSVGEIWRGFSKNAYGALGYNPLVALAVVLLLVPLLATPFVRVALGLFTGGVPGEALFQAAMLLTARLLTSLAGRDPLWTVPTHPVAVLFWGATLAWSMVLTTTDKTVEWRGRRVPVRSSNGDQK